MKYLHEKLKEYSKSQDYPMHMPGGKRLCHVPASEIDITEIPGFDDLAHPEGILKDLEEGFAKYYGADKTHMLVNGSTCGNLAAIYSVKDFGDTIIIGRNCHKSVYNAARLAGLKLEYIYPDLDNNGIAEATSAEAVEEVVKKVTASGSKIAGVVLTSPTYEGIVLDIKKISSNLHSQGIPLIVDAAHGAHIKACREAREDLFPKQKVKDCDICVMSLHKTLPSLNQAALIHVNGDLVEDDLIKKNINIFQTSSPSYPIMSSMSYTLEFMLEKEEAFEDYAKHLINFYSKCKKLRSFELMSGNNHDAGKLVIICKKEGYDGFDLSKDLHKHYHIVVELESKEYALAMTSVCDSKEGLDRLQKALFEIDEKIKDLSDRDKPKYCMPENEYVGVRSDKKIKQEEYYPGDVARNDVYAYPPGSPIIAEGEIISQEALDFLNIMEGKNK